MYAIRSYYGQPRLVARILQQGLMDKGVAENQTAITTYGREAIFGIFDACRPGDLLTMLLGHVEKHQLPGYIKEYADLLRNKEQPHIQDYRITSYNVCYTKLLRCGEPAGSLKVCSISLWAPRVCLTLPQDTQ